MNKLKLTISFVFISLLILSCSTNDVDITNSIEPLSLEKRIEKLKSLSKKTNKFYRNVNSIENLKSSIVNEENNELVDNIIIETKSIFDDLGMSEEFLISEINPNGDEDLDLIYALFGVSLAAQYESDPNISSRRSDIWGCLQTALGVDAFAAFLESAYHLYAGEVYAGFAADAGAAAAFRAAGVKAAKAAITRFAGGLGALIIIGEFVICMLS